ncbi:MAG: UDP-N-acetylmuramoyl-L-alanyl-D-glutamate--2,6-diaminopimelate ligase [Bacteroidota bacterium]
MPILKDILYKVSLTSTSGDMEVDVTKVCFDSRGVEDGAVFVAVRGTQVDGHAYIIQAVKSGAKAVICEELPDEVKDEVTYVTVKDTARALGIISSNFYNNPSAQLKLVAVTGTNGKTSIVTLLYNLFRGLGYNTGMLSTVRNAIDGKDIPSTHTTPDAVQINELLAQMVKKGCTHCFMEASSHAIVQERVSGLDFSGAVFTNISHDHLDYHKTFEGYINAKKKLFDDLPSSAFALVNIDDRRGRVMLQNTKASKHHYALKSMADFKGKIISNTLQGLEVDVDGKNIWFQLIGDFNAYNLLAAYATGMLLEEDAEQVLAQLSLMGPPPGRFEQVVTDTKITAIVDYAHTPDALKNVLDTIANFRTGNEQVITVVGCGGNRDKAKRPLMADVACRLSDKVIFTSDNPRDEEPGEIIKEMQTGVRPTDYKKTLVLQDREEAIKTACALARDNDIILVAGKGHETYQEIKGVKHPFDDREVLGRMLNLLAN